MYRTVLLVTLAITLLILPTTEISRAGTGPAASGETPASALSPAQTYVPGQVLVRFKPGTASEALASLTAPPSVTPLRRIARDTFTLTVPVGHEEEAVKTLATDPAVEHTSLNYVVTEPPIDFVELAPDEATEAWPASTQEIESCITDLWMSTTQQGEHLLDNMVPSGTAQVYVFFEYADCDLEELRVQVFFLNQIGAPEEVFNQEGTIISGSGIQGIKVQAWPYFDKGSFPVGEYLTIISLSPDGGWEEAKNRLWHVSTFPDDYWFLGISNYQWPLHSTGRRALPEADINMPQAWDITTGAQDFIVAVVSTGIMRDHPDLRQKIWTNRDEIPDNGIDDDENGCVDDVYGCEFFDGEAYPNPVDTGRWGTYTSGIIAADTNNKIGMAGISWGADILPIKVVRPRPDGVLAGSIADMILGINYAVENGARIIHIGPRIADGISPDQVAPLRSAIDDAVNQGVLVVAGAGDSGEASLTLPAGFDNVVAVGASGLRNERTWFSNYGEKLDLVAPGELILTTCGVEQYCIGSGTSLAAAHVEGVAALIWSVNPDLSPAEVRAILRESAQDLGAQGPDEEYGYGKLDADRALAQTTHHLWLRTAHQDQRSLIFLLDDELAHSCQRVWNLGTAPRTWTLKSNSEWLIVTDPDDPASAPVPSDIEVCADAGLVPGAGTFEGSLQANSTLIRHDNPETIDARVIYQPHLFRVRLSLVQRP